MNVDENFIKMAVKYRLDELEELRGSSSCGRSLFAMTLATARSSCLVFKRIRKGYIFTSSRAIQLKHKTFISYFTMHFFHFQNQWSGDFFLADMSIKYFLQRKPQNVYHRKGDRSEIMKDIWSADERINKWDTITVMFAT